MNQSSTIAAFLLIGFLVYITARGQLTSYLQVIGLVGGASTSGSNTGSTTNAPVVGIIQ